METSTLFWMMAMLSIIVGPFIYFASIAASKEKTKTKE